jgi:hypothetical protein
MTMGAKVITEWITESKRDCDNNYVLVEVVCSAVMEPGDTIEVIKGFVKDWYV